MTIVRCDLVDPIVVVTELRGRGIAFILVIDHESARVAIHADLAVFDRAQAVGYHRQPGNSERHGAQDVTVMECHLQALVEILVMHVMDAIHRMHIGLRKPLHRGVELRHHVIVVEEFARHRHGSRRHLIAGDLVAAAIDGVEQGLCQVDPGAEELHLPAEPHGRHAAGDRIVIAPERPHQIVVLVLQRGRVLADLDAVALEGLRHLVGPQHGDVRLRCGTEIVERMQHAVAALGHQRASVEVHAADAFGRPIGIAAE